MTRKPRLFLFVALALACVALSFPLQVVLLYGHSFTEIGAILNKISSLNLLCLITTGFVSYLVYQASPLTKWFAPLAIVMILWNNLVVGTYATDFSLASTTMATMGFALLFIPLTTKTSRFILADGKHRWWLRPKRYQKRVQAKLNPFVGATITAHTFDISKTGAFIHLDEESYQQEAPRVGESIRISLNIGGMQNVRCEAVIVRVTEPKGMYPTGLGLKFKSIDNNTKKDLERFLESSGEYLN